MEIADKKFIDFINKHDKDFQEAKTMKDIPHSYIVRGKGNDSNEFNFATQYVRDNGYPEPFYGVYFIYYEYNGYKYWSMGWPIKDTIILNRAKI